MTSRDRDTCRFARWQAIDHYLWLGWRYQWLADKHNSRVYAGLCGTAYGHAVRIALGDV